MCLGIPKKMHCIYAVIIIWYNIQHLSLFCRPFTSALHSAAYADEHGPLNFCFVPSDTILHVLEKYKVYKFNFF